MSLMGIDVGVTGCKAVVFETDGRMAGGAYREYPLHQPRPGWAEIDAEELWSAVSTVIRDAAGSAREPVSALSVASHGESILPLDRHGEPLGRFISAVDARAQDEADWWQAEVSRERIFQITGMPLHPLYSLPKLMWLRDHQPERYQQALWFVCVQDFVIHRLGLPPTVDFSLAARTMAFDIHRLEWSGELLELAQIDRNRMSATKPSGTIVGTIPAAVTAELGLASGAIAVTGGHDQPCGALGCGVIKAGAGMDSTGTVECVGVASRDLVLSPALLDSNLPVGPHTVSGAYFVLGYSATGGALLRWYRDTLADAEREKAARTGADVYDLLLDQADLEPSPVLILPHFVGGSGTPWMDARSKGAVVGLDFATTKGQLIKAMLDSVTYEVKQSLDAIEMAGIAVLELRAIGGGAKSEKWLQTKADIFGKPVLAMDVTEAPCLGAAILAGMASGVFPSVEDGVAAMVRTGRRFEPDARRHEAYMEKARLFSQLYPALATLNHKL